MVNIPLFTTGYFTSEVVVFPISEPSKVLVVFLDAIFFRYVDTLQMHHGWCEFLGEDLDDVGTLGRGDRKSSLRSLWLVVGHFNDLNARFCTSSIAKSCYTSKLSKLYCECFSNKKRTFSEMLFGSIGLLQKGLKRPGENPLTSHLHPQNLTLIPKLMGFGTCISAFKYGKHLGICLRLQVGTLGT